MTSTTNGPLHGIRIIDLSSVVMGPFCTQILGDMGADVIKVEPPTGDTMRWVGPMKNPGMGHIHLHLNRNKRSVVLDLKHTAGRAACLRLAAGADVLAYNVRPQSMERLGLGYADVQQVNSRIIYVGAFGYAEAGPYAGRPAYDDLIQGITGVAALNAQHSGDIPRYAPVTLADRTVGLHTANAILAALFHRERHGVGQAIEVSMFEAMAQFVCGDHLGGRTFLPALGETGYARLLAPHRRPYATRDGHLCVLIYNDKQWMRFFDAIARPDLKSDRRFKDHSARAANISAVYEFVALTLKNESTAYWRALFAKADIPFADMNTVDDLIADPHLKATAFFQETVHPTEGMLRTTAPVGHWSNAPLSVRRPAPNLGEHSREVLAEAGYSAAEIETLIAQGVTKIHS